MRDMTVDDIEWQSIEQKKGVQADRYGSGRRYDSERHNSGRMVLKKAWLY